jgi:hypothetical protein
MAIRINPRALEAACKTLIDGDPARPNWAARSPADRRSIIASAESLPRLYDEEKALDLAGRRAGGGDVDLFDEAAP